MRAGIRTTLWAGFDFHYDVGWMRKAGIRGMCIGRHVLFADTPHEIPTTTFRHELEHCYQIMREGWLRFYLKFFFYSLRHGYRNNPYEVEAREMENTPLTHNEETVLCNLRKDYVMSLSASHHSSSR